MRQIIASCVAVLFFCAGMPAQADDDLTRTTVASLPTSGPSGMSRLVVDGSTEADCTVGGGRFAVFCQFSGSSWSTGIGGGGSGAPTGATYITQTADAGLSAEQALGSLATGILKSTTTTGVLSIAAAGTDYVAGTPGTTANAIPRANGTGGTTIKGSGLTIDDSDNLTVPGNLVVNGTISTSGAGTTVLEMTEGAAPGAPATAGHHNLYIDSVDSRLKSHENGGSAVAYSTAASTDTYTNKTYDAEGTGNVLTVPRRLFFPAAGCKNATAGSVWDLPTSNPAVAACVTGTNTQKGVLDFADAANLSAQITYMLPTTWTGAIDARIKWVTTATTGDVVWQLSTICVADAETDDPAFNTASTVTDTAKGTTLQTNDASITGVTATGCAAGELMHLKIQRDSAHASDTLAATARLIGVELTIREAI